MAVQAGQRSRGLLLRRPLGRRDNRFMASRELPDVRAVVFDVGETLIDESRAWTEQARKVDVTPFLLMGSIGALIAAGRDHREVWHLLGVQAPETAPGLDAVDLYPDALACLRTARAHELVVGIAGNQPAGAEAQLLAAGFEADFIASSARWGMEKPSAAFFARVVENCGVSAEHVLYVGDRLDNDILPARDAGLRTAFVRRGPWGFAHSLLAEVKAADLRLDSLSELEELIASAAATRR